jgi:hypothetical protein
LAQPLLPHPSMRRIELQSASFLGGLTLGLAAAGVAAVTIRAARRRRSRWEDAQAHPIIDGAKPIDPVALTIGPPIESSASEIRLESEQIDPPVNSQRW